MMISVINALMLKLLAGLTAIAQTSSLIERESRTLADTLDLPNKKSSLAIHQDYLML